LGAVLRTAYAAGVKAILLADPALDPFGPNVMRNATGAIFAQPLFVGTSEEVQDLLARSGFTTFITHMHKDSVSMLDTQWPSKTAIVLGEESQGLSSNWLNKGYINTIIPMDGTLVDYLNVSVAAAVLLYHHKAQKG
jgi:TrmH family RNA methyltransferase